MTPIYEDNHIIIVSKQSGEIVQGDKTGDTPLSEEDIPEVLQLTFPHITGAILTYIAFEEIINGTLVEELEVLVGDIGGAILEFHVIKERVVLTAHIRACGYLSTHRNREAVVPETLCELE